MADKDGRTYGIDFPPEKGYMGVWEQRDLLQLQRDGLLEAAKIAVEFLISTRNIEFVGNGINSLQALQTAIARVEEG